MAVPFWNKIFPPNQPENPQTQKAPYRLRAHEIMVSYTHYGPTLSVSGDITAEEKIVMIKEIALTVSGINQNELQAFQWLADLPITFAPQELCNMSLKPANQFMISPGKSHSYNILFHDRGGYAEMKIILKDVRKKWQEYLKKIETASATAPEEQFEQFFASPDIQALDASLKHLLYWKGSEYWLRLHVTTQNGAKFNTENTFTLTEEHANLLKANTRMVIAEHCDQPKISYHFVTQKLFTKNNPSG